MNPIKSVENLTPSKIALYLLYLFIAYTLYYLISIRLVYKPIFDWWKINGGSKYDKDVPLFAMMTAYYAPSYIYYITKLSGTFIEGLTKAQMEFLVGTIIPHLYMIDKDGKESGFVKPRHIAEDIKFRPGDNSTFDDWYKKGYGVNGIPYNIDLPLTYPDKTSVPVTVDNHVGVYPDASNRVDWTKKFAEWGVKGMIPRTDMQIPDVTDAVAKEWFDFKKHPDNFLARYGILPDSPICVFFTNGKYDDEATGMKLDTEAFKDLIRGKVTQNASGWVGYLNGMGDNSSQDILNTTLFSRYATKQKPPPPPCPSKTGSILSTLASAGSMLAMVGAGMATGGAAFWAGLALTAVAAAPGTAKAVGAFNCKKPK
jgi:hypothetical protein